MPQWSASEDEQVHRDAWRRMSHAARCRASARACGRGGNSSYLVEEQECRGMQSPCFGAEPCCEPGHSGKCRRVLATQGLGDPDAGRSTLGALPHGSRADRTRSTASLAAPLLAVLRSIRRVWRWLRTHGAPLRPVLHHASFACQEAGLSEPVWHVLKIRSSTPSKPGCDASRSVRMPSSPCPHSRRFSRPWRARCGPSRCLEPTPRSRARRRWARCRID